MNSQDHKSEYSVMEITDLKTRFILSIESKITEIKEIMFRLNAVLKDFENSPDDCDIVGMEEIYSRYVDDYNDMVSDIMSHQYAINQYYMDIERIKLCSKIMMLKKNDSPNSFESQYKQLIEYLYDTYLIEDIKIASPQPKTEKRGALKWKKVNLFQMCKTNNKDILLLDYDINALYAQKDGKYPFQYITDEVLLQQLKDTVSVKFFRHYNKLPSYKQTALFLLLTEEYKKKLLEENNGSSQQHRRNPSGRKPHPKSSNKTPTSSTEK